MPVAAPAAAAAGHHRPLAVAQHVPAGVALGVLHDRAGRHADHERVGRGAVLVRALAVSAAWRLEVCAAAEARQVAQRGVGHEDHLAPAPAVTAVGAALGHVRLAAQRHHAVPPAPPRTKILARSWNTGRW